MVEIEWKRVQKTGEIGVGWSGCMKADVNDKWVGVGGNRCCGLILVKSGLEWEDIGRFGLVLVNLW